MSIEMKTEIGLGAVLRVIGVSMIAVVSATGLLRAKSKDDVVVMRSGDRMTGEIKSLENGVLYFKADYMVSSVGLDWDRVERLESKDSYVVLLTTGKTYTGEIERTARQPGGGFTVKRPQGDVQVHGREVVTLTAVESNLWKQLKGSIGTGFSYSQGENATQLSLSGDASYVSERYLVSSAGSVNLTTQAGVPNVTRYTYDLMLSRVYDRNWFVGALGQLTSSSQQNLILRTTLGGGLGRFIFRTNRSSVSLLVGGVYDNEHYSVTTGPSYTNNMEALLGLQYSTYRFKTTEFTNQLFTYYGLTDWGRFRLAAQSNISLEIAHNLYWNFSVYENFDSRPPANSPGNDFGTTSGVSWKF